MMLYVLQTHYISATEHLSEPCQSGETHAVKDGVGIPSLIPSRSGVPRITCRCMRRGRDGETEKGRAYLDFHRSASKVIIQHRTGKSVFNARALPITRHHQPHDSPPAAPDSRRAGRKNAPVQSTCRSSPPELVVPLHERHRRLRTLWPSRGSLRAGRRRGSGWFGVGWRLLRRSFCGFISWRILGREGWLTSMRSCEGLASRSDDRKQEKRLTR
jgi:hypothetical protein